jgi:hypothetical protein
MKKKPASHREALHSRGKSREMKSIDMTGMEVVLHGKPWEHPMSPCTKQAIALLERNERLVTWIKPIDGTVKDQVPCIKYKQKLYTLSLRMQKAIYRHVRLRKGFCNEVELLSFCGLLQ